MGQRMIPHHLENRGGERWGSGGVFRPSPLPHHPTPKGGWVVVRKSGVAKPGFRGGEKFTRFMAEISPFLTFAGAIL